MAGTITISTLSDGTNSTSATNPILGSVRAWVDFNGSPTSGSASIRSSYNVSSVAINGVGDYTITFTTALANANYAAIGNATGIGATATNPNGTVSTYAATTTTYRFQTAYRATNVDPGNENVADCRVAFFTS